MTPHMHDDIPENDSRSENCSPSPNGDDDSSNSRPKGRVLYCRKCEGHGEKVILKNHSPSCPYILCNCKSCEKLNSKRLKSFNKRNKEKIELAAALNAKRHAESCSTASDEGYFCNSRRSSFSSKTSSPGMDNDFNNAGLEGRSLSLGSMTVMSYDIWKAKCASEKKRLEDERGKKSDDGVRASSSSPKDSSPPQQLGRKRAHTFVSRNRTDDIPIVATKNKVSEEKKGKYILLPTIPAMRIFVDEEEEEAARMKEASQATTSSVQPLPPPIIPQNFASSSSSSAPAPLQRPSPVNPQLSFPVVQSSSLFKPLVHSVASAMPVSMMAPVAATMNPNVASTLQSMPSTIASTPITTMSTEQIISSLALHNTILQQQQNHAMLQELLTNLGSTSAQLAPTQSVDVLSMLRLQQQAAQLAAALQVSQPLPQMPKPNLSAPISTAHLLNSLLENPIYSNSM